MKFTQLNDLIVANQVKNKRVFIRADLNISLDQTGNITDDTRIRSSIPAICMAKAAGAAILITSHLGRPIEGQYDLRYSLKPVAQRLTELLNTKVLLKFNWINGVDITPGQVILLENCRFNTGETQNCEILAKKIATLCDIYVHDAFGSAHRIEATTYGMAKFAPIACAGPLLVTELNALNNIMQKPTRPLVAVIAGSKISTKLKILQTLSKQVDELIVGGGIANTFMLASKYEIGKSLVETNLIQEAKDIMQIMTKKNMPILMPIDLVCGTNLSLTATAKIKNANNIDPHEIIYDIGPKTAKTLAKRLAKAGTIIWNGPVGAFEFEQFSQGTKSVALAIANSKGFSIAGGGDTLAAIAKYHISKNINHISTGGGAFLKYLEDKTLPAIEILSQRAQ